MKCPVCGKKMKHYKGSHHYAESGLSNVVLQGIDQWECGCGEHVVEIPKVDDLHRRLGRLLIAQEKRLSGPEVRFLRKNLGLSGKEMAGLMGVNNATLSRWESGEQAIGAGADRLLRLIYAGKKGLATKTLIKQFPCIEPRKEQPETLNIPAQGLEKGCEAR
jgi:putative zinc finger/helix-turn-helix YgiT family protein